MAQKANENKEAEIMPPEKERELKALKAELAAEEEENKRLREEYLTEYNKALPFVGFKKTIVREKPNKRQEEAAQNMALDALSKKYKQRAIADANKSASTMGIPWAPGKGPTIEYPKVYSPSSAATQSDVLSGGSAAFSGGIPLARLERSLSNAPETESNKESVKRRQSALKNLSEKMQKYDRENLRGIIAASPKAASTDETEPDESSATAAATTEEEKAPATPADLTKQFASSNEYVDSSNIPKDDKQDLTSRLNSLEEKYDKAIEAYKAGADRVEIAKAIEKIVQGLALWGAGAYGKKHGVDAVSGLKFSPTDWSTRMTALEKELNAAQKKYTTGVEAIQEEEKSIRQEKREAAKIDKMIAAEQERETAAQEKLLRTATVGDIQATIKDMDTQVKNIDNALNQMKTAQFGKMNDAEKENALLAAALGAGISLEDMRKEKGYLWWKGQKFDEDTARQALINQKKLLQDQRQIAQNSLFAARSGKQVPAPAPAGQPAPQATKKPPLTPEDQAELKRLLAKEKKAKKERSGK